MNENTETWSPVVQWSRDPEARRGSPLVVLLHGYGSNEQDLMGLVPGLPEDFTYASVRAPQEVGFGYAWFELDPQRLAYRSNEAVNVVKDLRQWINSVRDQHSSVTLLGFSMGMCMATSLLRSGPEEFAAVVGLSGFAVDPGGDPTSEEFFDDAALAAKKVPFFWGRDQADSVIPQEYVEYTLQWAREAVSLTKVLYAGAGHGVVPQEVAHISEFLRATVLAR